MIKQHGHVASRSHWRPHNFLSGLDCFLHFFGLESFAVEACFSYNESILTNGWSARRPHKQVVPGGANPHPKTQAFSTRRWQKTTTVQPNLRIARITCKPLHKCEKRNDRQTFEAQTFFCIHTTIMRTLSGS